MYNISLHRTTIFTFLELRQNITKFQNLQDLKMLVEYLQRIMLKNFFHSIL